MRFIARCQDGLSKDRGDGVFESRNNTKIIIFGM